VEEGSGEVVNDQYFRGETAREQLIETLKAVMTDAQAHDVVDALDAYLDEGPNQVFTFPDLTPDFKGEVEKLRAERDAAVELAGRALREMQKTLESLRHHERAPEKEPK
jgi:hypothetical protein